MICTLKPDGVLVMSTIIDNQLVKRTYMGYTNKDAKKRFKAWVKENYGVKIK
jgi:hypothetical protein